MTTQQVANRQHLRSTYYAVVLVGPNGEREIVGHTQRKSGVGLMHVLYGDAAQARMRAIPNAAAVRMTKSADRLQFSNGWSLQFGETMRRESAADRAGRNRERRPPDGTGGSPRGQGNRQMNEHGFRRGSRVITEDGARGTVLYVRNGTATVSFAQDYAWGQRYRDVMVDDLYRDDAAETRETRRTRIR